MVLKSYTKEQIKEIKNDYEKCGKIVDENFCDEVFSLLRKEEAFYFTLKHFYHENSHWPEVFMENKKIYLNLDELQKNAEKKMKKLCADAEKILFLQNLYMLATILHESSHIWQVTACEEDTELNRFYRDLYEATEEIPLRTKISLWLNPIHFTHERQATIDAFRKCSDIYKDSLYHDIAQSYHLCHIYYLSNKQSALEKTIRSFRLKDTYDFSHLSFFKLLELGYPFPKDCIDYIHMIIDKYLAGDIEYQDAILSIEKAKILSKGV